jgi:hypothetical protein
MDPLVRATLALQQLVFRGTALVLSLALGVYLVCYATDPPPTFWNWAAAGLLMVSTTVHAVRRLRQLNPEAPGRIDLELFTSLTTVAYAIVLHTADGLDGPFYPRSKPSTSAQRREGVEPSPMWSM